VSRRASIVVLAVAAATIVADLGTKAWAERALADGAVDLGWVSLRLAQNPGVAFSIGAGAPAWVVLAVTTGAVVLLAVMAMRGVLRPPSAAGLLLGGGLGNLIDRFTKGTVTDMIDFGWFPSFNVADIALNVGVGLVLIVGLFLHDDEEPAIDDEEPAIEAAETDAG
jgi:signal peptidase II